MPPNAKGYKCKNNGIAYGLPLRVKGKAFLINKTIAILLE
jgi:hypothetical protein